MNLRVVVTALPLLVSLSAGQLAAQAQPAGAIFAQGLRAYQQLELTSAARLFRLALSVHSADSLSTSERADALMYLYAAEVLASRRDSAAAVSARLLAVQPRYEPDALVFPPEIIAAFERRRRDVKVVQGRIDGSPVLLPRGEPLRVVLVASSYHPVLATVLRDATPYVTIYDGPIEDSLDVAWNGLDADGNDAPAGRYSVQVASRDARGRTLRSFRLPFEVHANAAPVIAAAPEPSAPEPARAGSAMMFSVAGGVGLYSGTSTSSSAGTLSLSGVGLAGEGTLQFGRVGLRLGYGEATLKAKSNDAAGRKQVEGIAMIGVRTLPFLTFWVGPHARAWTSDLGNQRWLMWEIRAEAHHQLSRMLDIAVAGWSVAQGSVDASLPFDRGLGAMGRIDLRLGRSPLAASLTYRIERAYASENLQREANSVLGVWLRFQPGR